MEPVMPTTEAAIEECGEQRRALDEIHQRALEWASAAFAYGYAEGAKEDVGNALDLNNAASRAFRETLESTAPQQALNQVADQHGATGQGS